MGSERIKKSLLEKDSPVYVDPKTVIKGYLVIPKMIIDK